MAFLYGASCDCEDKGQNGIKADCSASTAPGERERGADGTVPCRAERQ